MKKIKVHAYSSVFYERKKGEEPVSMGNSKASADWFREKFFNLLTEVEEGREMFLMATMDARNQVKHAEVIAVGCLTGSLVHPREVFRPAVMRGAAAIILCHQHPSGDPSPSPEDIQLTERLIEAGRILGVRVLDHVVVAENGYVSLLDNRGRM